MLKVWQKQYGFEHSKIQRLIVDRPELLTLKPGDYLKFFEEATHIACQAGFEGLLVLADEVQQYIDPKLKQVLKIPLARCLM
ncbi:MAG: hypothetical protein H6633_12720 [Anaerolineales bacterium]|nr:hypothetical protein [Anaerolineales bacterium]